MDFRQFIEQKNVDIPEGNPLAEMVNEFGNSITNKDLDEHIKYIQSEFDVICTGELLEKADDVVFEISIKRVLHQLVDVGNGKYMLVVNGIKTKTIFDDLEKAKEDLEKSSKFNADSKQKHLGSKLKKRK